MAHIVFDWNYDADFLVHSTRSTSKGSNEGLNSDTDKASEDAKLKSRLIDSGPSFDMVRGLWGGFVNAFCKA